MMAQMKVKMIPMRNKMGMEESRCWFSTSLANVVWAIVRNRIDVVVMVVMTKMNVIMITVRYQVRVKKSRFCAALAQVVMSIIWNCCQYYKLFCN